MSFHWSLPHSTGFEHLRAHKKQINYGSGNKIQPSTLAADAKAYAWKRNYHFSLTADAKAYVWKQNVAF